MLLRQQFYLAPPKTYRKKLFWSVLFYFILIKKFSFLNDERKYKKIKNNEIEFGNICVEFCWFICVWECDSCFKAYKFESNTENTKDIKSKSLFWGILKFLTTN